MALNERKMRNRNGNYSKENEDTVTEYESRRSVFSKYNIILW